jgi:hypothetical protein
VTAHFAYFLRIRLEDAGFTKNYEFFYISEYLHHDVNGNSMSSNQFNGRSPIASRSLWGLFCKHGH